MNDSVIHLEGVTKVFLTDEVETHALAGVHLEIKKGEYFSISGTSGCGKSTLLSILGLLDSPTDGTYQLNVKPVQDLSMSERARVRNREIGFIFQSFNLIGDLSVYENVELPLTYRGLPAADRRRRVGEALERVSMAHRSKHLPSQLSGGQQQRVAVARALAGDPLNLRHPDGALEMSMTVLRDVIERSRVLNGVAGWDGSSAFVTTGGEPQRFQATASTAGLTQALGVQPLLGRWFNPEECTRAGLF